MCHFIIEIIYNAPIEKIEEIVDKHRAFLKQGYENGVILFSGPQVPRIGGVVVARAESMEKIVEFFKEDPYQKEGFAHYQYIQFSPVMHQDFIKDWIENK